MSTETITLDASDDATAAGRVSLDITPWIKADGIDWGDAQIQAYMAEAARGELPVDFRVPNRTITIPFNLMTVGGTSFATIRADLQAKAALFQREGGWLKRDIDGTAWYADVVNATLHLGGDWMTAARDIDTAAVLTLECLPDFYGDEVTLDSQSETTLPELTGVLKEAAANAVIAGDYPGRVRVVVTDASGVAQLGAIVALRSRHYDSAATAKLAYEAEALTPLDAAAVATVTGSSGGGTNNAVTHSNLSTNWTPVLSTQIATSGHMTHKGSYRVWARCRTTSSTPPRVRLVWDVGDFTLPTENMPATRVPNASNWYMIDLGEVRIDPSPVGTHRWLGQIQGAGDVGGENLSIDRIWIAPIDEAYTVLRAPAAFEPGLANYSARDEFNQTSGALGGKTAAVGGNWATTGDTTDFSVGGLGAPVTRATTADTSTGRFATLPVSLTAVVAQVDVTCAAPLTSSESRGLLVRYTDTSNFMRARASGSKSALFTIEKVVAGVATTLGTVTAPGGADATYTYRLAVDAGGRWMLYSMPQGGDAGDPLATGQDAALATGGALASGAVGIWDRCTSTGATRTYDNFAAWSPAIDAVVNGSQSLELRWDGAFREDSTGTVYGPVSEVLDALPRIPPAGMENRTVELLVKASRGDLDILPDTGIDDITAQAFYRPSWLVVPVG